MRARILDVAILAFFIGAALAVGVIIVGIAMIEPTPPPEMWMTHHG